MVAVVVLWWRLEATVAQRLVGAEPEVDLASYCGGEPLAAEERTATDHERRRR